MALCFFSDGLAVQPTIEHISLDIQSYLLSIFFSVGVQSYTLIRSEILPANQLIYMVNISPSFKTMGFLQPPSKFGGLLMVVCLGISTSFNLHQLPTGKPQNHPRGMARFAAFNCPTSVPSVKNAAVPAVTSDYIRESRPKGDFLFWKVG